MSTEDFVAFHLHIHSFGAELVDSFSFSQEQLGQLVRVVRLVDELSHPLVEVVVRYCDVDGTLVLQLDDQLLQVQDVLGENRLTSSLSTTVFLR